MTIHKEGFASIAIAAVVTAVIIVVFSNLFRESLPWLFYLLSVALIGFFLFIVSFFRVPKRTFTQNNEAVISPCDGKVVVIEETVDEEYFKTKVLQVSVFMSPANVHVNWNPINGEVVYNQYHKGKYLVAWDPKSSTDNERHSVVISHQNGKKVLAKQIAGAVARRIVNYLTVGQQVRQGEQMGFIKFGSRVDLLMPIDAKVQVKIGDMVQGGISVIAVI